jgi:hypothetical protein
VVVEELAEEAAKTRLFPGISDRIEQRALRVQRVLCWMPTAGALTIRRDNRSPAGLTEGSVCGIRRTLR